MYLVMTVQVHLAGMLIMNSLCPYLHLGVGGRMKCHNYHGSPCKQAGDAAPRTKRYLSCLVDSAAGL